MRLLGKVALITGGANGIGLATVERFAREGSKIILWDMSEHGATVVERLKSDGVDAIYKNISVAEMNDVQEGVAEAVKHFGRIDILINNAGIYPRQAFLGMSEAQWDEMQEINLKSMFHTLQKVLPHMVARRGGKVVNISSVTFHLGMALLSHYVASKGGVIGLTRSLAREMGEHNIHINCITPGAIKTEAEAKVLTEEQAQVMMASQCLQRRIMPLDIARVCLFLSSELSDGMTGQTINVDGGWMMY